MASCSDDGNDDIELLILGKAGTGKSSTGDSIMGRNAFVTRPGGGTPNKVWMSQFGYTRIKGRVIKVMDTPGLDLPSSSNHRFVEKTASELSKALCLHPNGFSALLLVLKFGERFTEEERAVIKLLKRLLGREAFQRLCILVFTNGEQLDIENKRLLSAGDEPLSFMQWLRNQREHLEALIEECDHRCVLFRNLTRDQEVRDEQLSRLLFTVDKIRGGGLRFDKEMFQKVRDSRDKLRQKVLLFQESLQRKICLIQDTLGLVKKLASNQDGKHDEVLQTAMTQLQEDITSLKDEMSKEEKNVQKVLAPLKEKVEGIEKEVTEETMRMKDRQQWALTGAILKGVIDDIYLGTLQQCRETGVDRKQMLKLWQDHTAMLEGVVRGEMARASIRRSSTKSEADDDKEGKEDD